uniref:CASP C-terminal domain-containing protein n=1 Tax=Tetraselmis chuii TaxID=63592 RepID=A0A7S1SKV6_9CHLO|mmetsp:Transcript_17623/g.31440  ORF Transcript_17623/g.31440 Transcript_17623/m.31440 type:complete len:176 (+) Transcript_17623:11-538(+)
MVTVVCGQRDRFRKRCLELEEAVQRGVAEVLAAQNDLRAARADNVALVERMRYLQGYKGSGGHKREQAGDVESRYAAEYEEQLNPFAKFQEKQREGHRRRMSVADKAVLSAGSLILGSKYARAFAFFYTIVLHAMIFAVLFRMSHHTHNTHVKDELLASKDAFLQTARNSSGALP